MGATVGGSQVKFITTYRKILGQDTGSTGQYLLEHLCTYPVTTKGAIMDTGIHTTMFYVQVYPPYFNSQPMVHLL